MSSVKVQYIAFNESKNCSNEIKFYNLSGVKEQNYDDCIIV